QQFAKRLPDIYNHLCVLLNQNLINKKSDYSIQEGFAENINRKLGRIPIPKTIRKNYSHHSWHWSLTILLVGIFLTSWLTPLFISYTDLDFHESVCFYFGAVLLGGVLQYPLIIRRKVMSFGIYLIYLILGFSPTACSSILFLNKQISMGRIEEKHQIISWSYKKDINPFLKGSFVILNLENNAYGYFERARAFEYSTFYTVKSKKNKPDSLTIGFSKGIFGLKAFKENTVSFSLHKND
ncbi:hypothetical protein JYU20_01180, partial [Bacteroidales bacterium AH-315-I05]|nr:hypothetical protein [Bacteroidales bacterium AH-315-I05]